MEDGEGEDYWDAEEAEAEGGEGGGGGSSGAGAAPRAEPPPPLPPLLTCIVGLDQLSITRALARGAQAARDRGPHVPPPLAEAAWLYALLAALQLPFTGATAATLRELFLLHRDQRRALLRSHQHHLLAAPSLLCLLAGRYFGQAWE